jgi:hypothetical protein
MTIPPGLRDNRSRIIERWGELILAGYPEASSRFLHDAKDPFGNPVGSGLRRAVEVLYDGLLEPAAREDWESALDGIVRIRAVQDFTPARAVGFVFLLKDAVREVLGDGTEAPAVGPLLEFHRRIDDLALEAFDRFARCREKLHEIKARDAIARTYSLLRQAGLLVDGGDAGGRGGHAGGGPGAGEGGQEG